MERSAIRLEFKELDTKRRTAVIMHSVYGSIDRGGDIVERGSFTKSWKENPKVDFLFNHKEGDVIGKVTRLFDDEKGAYTEVKFGTWTLANDVLDMADLGVLKGASFGYIAQKKEYTEIKGKKIRKLKEVIHIETSVLTKQPMHPNAGIVSLTKGLEGVNLDEIQNDIAIMERFCRNSSASDYAIKAVMQDLEETKQLLDNYRKDSCFSQAIRKMIDRLDGKSENEDFSYKLRQLSDKM